MDNEIREAGRCVFAKTEPGIKDMRISSENEQRLKHYALKIHGKKAGKRVRSEEKSEKLEEKVRRQKFARGKLQEARSWKLERCWKLEVGCWK